MDLSDLERALAFDRRIVERVSTDRIPFPGGVAYLDRRFPRRYDSNFLCVDDTRNATAQGLAAQADRILGGAGLDHRKIELSDPDAAEGLAFGFAELGYAIENTAVMVKRRAADRSSDLESIEEHGFDDEVRELQMETTRREKWGTDEEVVTMLVGHHGELAKTIGARFFAARVDGRLAGSCELYLDGDEAQIESVDTLEEYRGRGLASAFVLRAAAEARAAGAAWIHLYADGDDWPKHWYAKLGFDEVGHLRAVLRTPYQHAKEADT